MLASAAGTLGVPCVLEERELLRWQAKALIEAHREIHRSEQRIEQTLAKDDTLPALPKALGRVTAAVLLATVGSPANYPTAASYCKALGLNLKERSSGTHQGRLAITKRGPPVARFYLYFAALRLIAQEPLVARWFALKTARPGALKGKQVVELMRRLAKGLWHHLHGHPFQIEKLFNTSAMLGTEDPVHAPEGGPHHALQRPLTPLMTVAPWRRPSNSTLRPQRGPHVVLRRRPGWPMGCLPDEADPMTPAGAPAGWTSHARGSADPMVDHPLRPPPPCPSPRMISTGHRR